MMWPFRRTPTKSDLEDHKEVRLGEYRFVIRRINPLLDFPADKIPTVFAVGKQYKRPAAAQTEQVQRQDLEQMFAVVEAGVVEPKLYPRPKKGKEAEGITVEDLFRWSDVGPSLYLEIIAHATKTKRGWAGFLESSATRQDLLTRWQNATDAAQVNSSSGTT